MRIAVGVVVGVVLLGVGSTVFAAEPRRERAEYCVDGCNLAFERCQAQKSSKSNSGCDIEAVKCKNACPFVTVEEPAVPTARSHGRCIDDCRTVYKKCLGKAENKRGGNCAADDVRCEQACPKPPEAAVATEPGAPAAGTGAAGTAAPGTAPVAAPAAKKPKRAARVEGAAAPAPVSAPPIVVPERPAAAAAPPAPVKSEAVTPPTEAGAPAQAGSTERGFFGTIGCFFKSCEPAGSTPCLNQCATSYDECHVRESKRGGECNTRLMNCRQVCRDAPPAAR